jgi:spermidine/putrescine transport system permease protein
VIYGATRAAPLPSTNAIATIMMVLTLLSLFFAYLGWRMLSRQERKAEGEPAAQSLAAFEL